MTRLAHQGAYLVETGRVPRGSEQGTSAGDWVRDGNIACSGSY